jgi:hypothetical protein
VAARDVLLLIPDERLPGKSGYSEKRDLYGACLKKILTPSGLMASPAKKAVGEDYPA